MERFQSMKNMTKGGIRNENAELTIKGDITMRPKREENLLYGGFLLIFVASLLTFIQVLTPTQMSILITIAVISMAYSSTLQYFRHRSIEKET